MKAYHIVLLLLLTWTSSFSATPIIKTEGDTARNTVLANTGTLETENETICISPSEVKLASLINEYRRTKKLPPIPVSSALSKVAKLHVVDLAENYSKGDRCNLHSWSKDSRWSSCCYTPDHKKASCMWDKPRELSSYKGDGYEIAFFSNFDYTTEEEFAADALEGWQSSRGHNEIIINSGRWKTADWKAMGVGIYKGYTVVWFGELTDLEGKPEVCQY